MTLALTADATNTQGILQRVLEQQQALARSIEDLTDVLATRGQHTDVPAADPSDTTEPLVRVMCLGRFELTVNGLPVDGWRSRRARALLQYLIAHHHRPASRDALIQALWPEPDAVAAATSLKVAVHALRQVLGPCQSRTGAPLITVRTHEVTYELCIAGQLWLDTEQFERACAHGRQLESEHRWNDARLEYARAADLYGGEFLPEAWDDWVVLRREHLRDSHLFALSRLAEYAFQDGDFQLCIRWCEQLLAEDRCREDTYRLLMRSHARLGQPGRARRWYELCVRTLRADLGVDVDESTEHEFQDTLRLTHV